MKKIDKNDPARLTRLAALKAQMEANAAADKRLKACPKCGRSPLGCRCTQTVGEYWAMMSAADCSGHLTGVAATDRAEMARQGITDDMTMSFIGMVESYGGGWLPQWEVAEKKFILG